MLVRRSTQSVIVIEAIKLLEGDLQKACDTIWVTYAPQVVQIERLTRKRNMTGRKPCTGSMRSRRKLERSRLPMS